jgi:HTH-type transcriptional regulator / antitoxin HigA
MNHAKIVKTAHEHKTALERIAELMDADPVELTPEADELELLALLVDPYEEEHFPIDRPDPIDAIRFRMEQMGLRNKDLVPYIGSAPKVSEVLNRKRDLSLNDDPQAERRFGHSGGGADSQPRTAGGRPVGSRL